MPHEKKRWPTVAQIQFQITYSNLDFSEWGDAFAGNRILGAATLDRLRHGAYRIVLDGDSFRTPRPMPEPDQTRLAKSAKKTHS